VITHEARPAGDDKTAILAACIFDVDGVLLASPHEQAWREALLGIADPSCFTTALYQAHVAGRPRLAGALAGLQALGVPNAPQLATAYAERKQKRLEALIEAGAVSAYPDAVVTSLDEVAVDALATGRLCRNPS
jgi:beta-phosphoglucomutase-like phosphatase (HAD superfamily)